MGGNGSSSLELWQKPGLAERLNRDGYSCVPIQSLQGEGLPQQWDVPGGKTMRMVIAAVPAQSLQDPRLFQQSGMVEIEIVSSVQNLSDPSNQINSQAQDSFWTWVWTVWDRHTKPIGWRDAQHPMKAPRIRKWNVHKKWLWIMESQLK